ncbi:MAG: hypothetical protein KM310_06965 [Clostridiales bacterium]|nr:hypothetical protein [Clostridiales bacterium]
MTPKAREALEKILRYAHLYGAKKTERLLNEFLKTYPSAKADEVVQIMRERGMAARVEKGKKGRT